MKKLFFWLPVLFFGLGILSACSEDDGAALDDGNIAVSFKLNIDNFTKALVQATDDETNMDCPEPDDAEWFDGTYKAIAFVSYFDKTAEPVQHELDLIKGSDGSIRTSEIMMALPESGSHWLQKLLIVKKEDPSQVILATVGENSIYKSHVIEDHLMPMELSFAEGGKLKENEKPVIDISLLCAVHESSDSFGFALWGLNFVKVVCLDYTVNAPEDPCVDGSADIVAKTEITLTKQYKEGEDWVDMLVHKGTSSNGVKGNICFNDQGNIADEDERYYMEIKVINDDNSYYVIGGTMTLAQMYDYKCSGFWVIPNGGTHGLLHFDLYDADLKTIGAAIPYPQDITADRACANATAWELKVIDAVECTDDETCDETCETEFLSDLFTFELPTPPEPTLCDWWAYEIQRFSIPENYIYLGSGAYLKTPAKKFNANDTIQVVYGSGDIVVDFMPVGDNTGTMDVEPTVISTENDCYIQKYVINEEGCFRVRIASEACCPQEIVRYPYIFNISYLPVDNPEQTPTEDLNHN